jgi:hypothetical protein
MEEVFVRMLPGVAGRIMRRRATAEILIPQLPQRLTLQAASMAPAAIGLVEVAAAGDERGVVGIGEMGWLVGRRAGMRGRCSERENRSDDQGRPQRPNSYFTSLRRFSASG